MLIAIKEKEIIIGAGEMDMTMENGLGRLMMTIGPYGQQKLVGPIGPLGVSQGTSGFAKLAIMEKEIIIGVMEMDMIMEYGLGKPKMVLM